MSADRLLAPSAASSPSRIYYRLDHSMNAIPYRASLRPPPNDLEHHEAVFPDEAVSMLTLFVPRVICPFPPYPLEDNNDTTESGTEFASASVTAQLSRSGLATLAMLVPGERAILITNAFRVEHMDAVPALVILTQARIRVFASVTLTPNGDITVDAKRGAEDTLDDNATTGAGGRVGALSRLWRQANLGGNKQQSRMGAQITTSLRRLKSSAPTTDLVWTYTLVSIREVVPQQYLHIDAAVDVQMSFDKGVFLVVLDRNNSMNPTGRNAFIHELTQINAHITVFDCAKELSRYQRLWVNGLMSNYSYLTYLNRSARRCVRVWNQFPVMPWVLADYQSASLGMTNPQSYRDLSLPMGAQREEKRLLLQKRFQSFDHADDDSVPTTLKPFHYGTHYTSAGAVLYFMIRMQPFMNMGVALQSGKFDHADRLFSSVEESYHSATSNWGDCKELIQEAYWTTSPFMHRNHAALGRRQDGHVITDVRLPPWAKNSPTLFVAAMRAALDGDIVSQQLHNWIDLIFGAKQTGPAAVEYYNVFQHLTYGPAVRQAILDAQSTQERDAVISEADNFGQTPVQLFALPHPQRLASASVITRTELILTQWRQYSISGGTAAAVVASPGGGAGSSGSATLPGTGAALAAGVSGGGPSVKTFGFSPDANSSVLSPTSPSTLSYKHVVLSPATKDTFIVAYSNEFPLSSEASLYASAHRLVHRRYQSACVDAVALYAALQISSGGGGSEGTTFPASGVLAGNYDGSVVFKTPCHSRVTAVWSDAAMSLALVGTASGVVYCLILDPETGELQFGTSLVAHQSAVRGFATNVRTNRAVSFTSSPLDAPVVWRLLRQRPCFMHRLDASTLAPIAAGGAPMPPLSSTTAFTAPSAPAGGPSFAAAGSSSGRAEGAAAGEAIAPLLLDPTAGVVVVPPASNTQAAAKPFPNSTSLRPQPMLPPPALPLEDHLISPVVTVLFSPSDGCNVVVRAGGVSVFSFDGVCVAAAAAATRATRGAATVASQPALHTAAAMIELAESHSRRLFVVGHADGEISLWSYAFNEATVCASGSQLPGSLTRSSAASGSTKVVALDTSSSTAAIVGTTSITSSKPPSEPASRSASELPPGLPVADTQSGNASSASSPSKADAACARRPAGAGAPSSSAAASGEESAVPPTAPVAVAGGGSDVAVVPNADPCPPATLSPMSAPSAASSNSAAPLDTNTGGRTTTTTTTTTAAAAAGNDEGTNAAPPSQPSQVPPTPTPLTNSLTSPPAGRSGDSSRLAGPITPHVTPNTPAVKGSDATADAGEINTNMSFVLIAPSTSEEEANDTAAAAARSTTAPAMTSRAAAVVDPTSNMPMTPLAAPSGAAVAPTAAATTTSFSPSSSSASQQQQQLLSLIWHGYCGNPAVSGQLGGGGSGTSSPSVIGLAVDPRALSVTAILADGTSIVRTIPSTGQASLQTIAQRESASS